MVEAGERFLTAVDDPPGAPRLDDALAACAGVVAELQELSAKAGLGSGDLVVWIGDDPRMALGARLSRARGCPTFTLGAAAEATLRLGDGPAAWGEALAVAAASAPGGFLERRLFVARADPALLEAALALAVPGTSVAIIDGSGGGTLPAGALASCRVLVAAGFGYHPDLVPEALATLRREAALTEGLVAEGRGAPMTLVRR